MLVPWCARSRPSGPTLPIAVSCGHQTECLEWCADRPRAKDVPTEAGTTVMIAIANASTFVLLLNIAILLVMSSCWSALANAAIAFCDGGHIAHRRSRHRDSRTGSHRLQFFSDAARGTTFRGAAAVIRGTAACHLLRFSDGLMRSCTDGDPDCRSI